MSLVNMFNISFIGMPGCGKSTLGNAISKELNLSFVDTDLIIEKKFEMTLEDVKNKFGYQFVRSSEEEVILSLDSSSQIISTGGSAVYSSVSMEHLKAFARIIYIDTSLDTIIKRYETYMKTTKPVLNYYSKKPNFHEIDGTQKIEEITAKIDAFLNV